MIFFKTRGNYYENKFFKKDCFFTCFNFYYWYYNQKRRKKEETNTITLPSYSTKLDNLNLENIIVIDTNQDLDSNSIVNIDQRFFILTPYKSGISTLCYETCDHQALCTISYEGSYLSIENLDNTVYYVNKDISTLTCISSLETILYEKGLEEYIKPNYSSDELIQISQKINQKEKVLAIN